MRSASMQAAVLGFPKMLPHMHACMCQVRRAVHESQQAAGWVVKVGGRYRTTWGKVLSPHANHCSKVLSPGHL